MYAIKKALDRKVHFDIMIQSEEPDEKSFRFLSMLDLFLLRKIKE